MVGSTKERNYDRGHWSSQPPLTQLVLRPLANTPQSFPVSITPMAWISCSFIISYTSQDPDLETVNSRFTPRLLGKAANKKRRQGGRLCSLKKHIEP